MTMLNNTSGHYATSAATRRAIGSIVAGLGRLINKWIAAVIAQREHQANLTVLRTLNERELRDMGLDRSQIWEGLAEAAKDRSRQHKSVHR